MKKTLVICISLMFIFACSDDKSDTADIIDFSITSSSIAELEIKGSYIDSENGKVYLFLNNDLYQHSFPIVLTTNIVLSSGAKTASIVNGEMLVANPDEVKTILVEAEDGTQKNWSVFLIHKQFQNSKFENWYSTVGMNGLDYLEIGTSAVSSLWATANMGTSMYKAYGTQPLNEGSNKFVNIKSDSTINIPITAGTLFTGLFNIAGAISNPTDPKKATHFGVPFIFRPTGLKVYFKYQAGERFVQASLNNPTNIFGGFTVRDIEGEDQCSIYAILEIRNGTTITEIARAELNTGTTSDVLTENLIPFTYTSEIAPTHITIVFTSSKDGDLWRGAKGSSLIIDKLELVY